MGLERYWQKRDFEKTQEPHGKPRKKRGFSYVIQKHAASHLHYDFRLELDGVLLSWAVPKGPCLDPNTKRLAMQTEDHPVEYGTFEGTIPKGEYGGGTVMVWDSGTWEPDGDPRDQYEKGRLTFRLKGKKLKGSWHLVRTKTRDQGDKRSWLLFKGSDAEARPGDGAIVEERPDSAKTGRSLEQIAADADAVWHSNREARAQNGSGRAARATARKTPARSRGRNDTKPVATRTPSKPMGAAELGRVAKAKRAKLPASVEPALATLVSEAPSGDDWLHELKFDGYRLLVRIDRGAVTIFSRNGKDWTRRIPVLSRAFSELPIENAIIDGEAVTLNEAGVSDFQLLQNSLGDDQASEKIVFYAFDLLHLNGFDLRAVALEARKELLKRLLGAASDGAVRLSDHVVGSGAEFYERACEMGLEGIVAKRRDAPYGAGRTRDWLKVKCLSRQEFVIGGYTEPAGSRGHLGALLLGDYSGKDLVYRGKVGTGFTRRSLQELHERLAPLERRTPPFHDAPRGADAKGVHWVKPALLAEVDFTCLTDEGLLRHGTFRGVRTDKSPRDVVLEKPAPSESKAKSKTKSKTKATSQSSAATFRLTNPERVLYREEGITKRDLAEYYASVAEWMLPHVADRPLTLVRCPEGYDKQCFFQKHAKDSLPDGVRPIPIADKEGTVQYTAIDDAQGLIGLVQMGVLEIHTWGAHADDPEKPDLLVFDLDPDPAVSWADVVGTAKLLRQRFETVGLQTFVKTTGGKGLHVCVPVARRLDWDRTKEFCRRFSERIVREDPSRFIATMSKARRKGKIFIDFFRNSRGATFIAPYSTRARQGAPVAVPLAWDELSGKLSGDHFNVRNLPKRLARLRRDPWAELPQLRQTLSAAILRDYGV